MKTIIKNKNTITEKDHVIILSDKKNKISSISLNSQEKKFIKEQQKENKEIIILNQYTRKIIVVNPKKINNYNLYLENLRCLGDKVFEEIKGLGVITINTIEREIINTYAFVEGMALSNYKFTNHKSKKEKEQNLTIYIYKNANSTNISEIERLAKAVRVTKDLVNTPFSH